MNYAQLWKDDINLKQISYNDFISLNPTGIYSQKIDGMQGVLIYKKDSEPYFQTTRGHFIKDIPALYEYAELLKKHDIKEIIIPGELVGKKGGEILPFNITQSVVKTSYLPQNQDLVHHYPADIYSLNGRRVPYPEAIVILFRMLKVDLPHINFKKPIRGDMEVFRKMYLSLEGKTGFDGVVARQVDGKNYKVKFTSTVDLCIIGAGQIGLPAWNKKQVSYLITSFVDKDGFFRSSSKIGSGFTFPVRSKLYEYINKNKLYEKDGEIFVKPEMVLEMKYFRYRITETPTYKFEKNEYVQVGNYKSITFSHPSFSRPRDDKEPNKNDCRLEQIPEFMY